MPGLGADELMLFNEAPPTPRHNPAINSTPHIVTLQVSAPAPVAPAAPAPATPSAPSAGTNKKKVAAPAVPAAKAKPRKRAWGSRLVYVALGSLLTSGLAYFTLDDQSEDITPIPESPARRDKPAPKPSPRPTTAKPTGKAGTGSERGSGKGEGTPSPESRKKTAEARKREADDKKSTPKPDVKAPKSTPTPTPSPTPRVESTPAPEAPVQYGSLTVNSKPWATVWIDGQQKGISPLTLKLPVGTHQVTLVSSTGEKKFQVEIKEGKRLLKVWSFEENAWVGDN
jgi:hypothetical protein